MPATASSLRELGRLRAKETEMIALQRKVFLAPRLSVLSWTEAIIRDMMVKMPGRMLHATVPLILPRMCPVILIILPLWIPQKIQG